ALPVVEAPRPSVHVALVHARRSRSGAPRFGRTGFPLDPKDHAARRDRVRARVVTTTVVATVVAAPVIALWAAYRGAPLTGEGRDGSSVTATEVDESGSPSGDPEDHYENAGNARLDPGGRFTDGGRRPDVSAEVVSVGAGRHTAGTLRITALSSGGRTTITLTATGGEPVSWSARADAPWLRLSRASGTLAPGRSTTLYVLVDRAAEPAGPWRARVVLAPSGSAVAITGHGATAPAPGNPAPGPDPTPGRPDPTTPSSPPPVLTRPDPGLPGPHGTDARSDRPDPGHARSHAVPDRRTLGPGPVGPAGRPGGHGLTGRLTSRRTGQRPGQALRPGRPGAGPSGAGTPAAARTARPAGRTPPCPSAR
ncbi:hypothetical protein GA0115235_11258, partial [Streptomyces sp. DpondAA-F4a]